MGSAQRRFQHAILQHGSIPLTVDRERLASLARPGPGDDADALARAMVSLAEAGGGVRHVEEVAAVLGIGFEETFGIILREAGYHPAERRLADRLEEAAAANTVGPPWAEHRIFNALTPRKASVSVA